MPPPTPDLITRMGPPTLPFGRLGGQRSVLKGEDLVFSDHLFNATDDGRPENVVAVESRPADESVYDGKYLWVIDEDGLRTVLEAIPNSNAERGNMCHTNITGGQEALQGGEMWFGSDGNVYINDRSGRYGAENDVQWDAVVEYFGFVWYNVENLV